jgi:hypothetical protein
MHQIEAQSTTHIFTMVQPHPGATSAKSLLAQGQNQGSTPRVHQQALAIGPFGNTFEVDAVSPKAYMRGLQDRDVYN